MRVWPKLWVTAGWAGFCPVAPGTSGSLVGVLLAMGVSRWSEVQRIQDTALVAIALLFAGVTLIWGEEAERAFGRRDPPQVVSDEVAGMLVSLLWLPALPAHREWLKLALPFALFRLFDIWKPGPLRRWQRLPGGAGILLDDLGAGLLANAASQLLLRGPLEGLLAYGGL